VYIQLVRITRTTHPDNSALIPDPLVKSMHAVYIQTSPAIIRPTPASSQTLLFDPRHYAPIPDMISIHQDHPGFFPGPLVNFQALCICARHHQHSPGPLWLVPKHSVHIQTSSAIIKTIPASSQTLMFDPRHSVYFQTFAAVFAPLCFNPRPSALFPGTLG
jgi:hypothetical protein